jgi:hypothetical protein
MPDSVGTLAIALYGALLSSATAASQFYQIKRKQRRYGYNFEHHPVRIHDDVGYIDDYLVKAVIINRSESEITVLRATFGIDKLDAGRFPRHNLEGYGKDGEIEFPFIIPGMSAKVLYSFARHWRRDDTLEKIPEKDWDLHKLYLTIQVVGDEKERVVEVPNAGPALLRHEVVRVRDR